MVQARFYRPDLWRYLDPVITAEPEQVRMECFSSCCSVYGRVDFAAAAFDGYALLQRGTTNVNLNPAFIQGLQQLSPGQRSVQLSTADQRLKEDKVKLPTRWLKAFLPAEALWREASCWQNLHALQARQLLTRLSGKDDGLRYLTPTPQGLQVLNTHSHRAEGLAVAGLQRLKLLKPLLPHLQSLAIYTLPAQGTVWVAQLPQARVTLALSASVKHGFSGEGEALRSLSAQPDAEALAFVRQIVPGLVRFTLAELAHYLETSPETVLPLLDTLAMDGLLGYDVTEQAWFYRVLPFAAQVPLRLQNARALLAQHPVALEQLQLSDNGLQASGWVQGTQARYYGQLEIRAGQLHSGSCTCQWYRQHQLQRGPCKHLLALRFAAEAAAASEPSESQCLE
ncbi:MAG: SWIM zinc finger family protein [Candidatus Sericytochromatia bacterium]|nr:SWIM zinc finger family protein [Candidatus Sericytochromatia bacterium]